MSRLYQVMISSASFGKLKNVQAMPPITLQKSVLLFAILQKLIPERKLGDLLYHCQKTLKQSHSGNPDQQQYAGFSHWSDLSTPKIRWKNLLL